MLGAKKAIQSNRPRRGAPRPVAIGVDGPAWRWEPVRLLFRGATVLVSLTAIVTMGLLTLRPSPGET